MKKNLCKPCAVATAARRDREVKRKFFTGGGAKK